MRFLLDTILMDYDKIISKLFFDSDWHINKSIRRKFLKKVEHNKCVNLYTYIINRFNEYDNIKEVLYRIKHKAYIRPVCKECGNRVNFIGKGKILFSKYCSCKCRANSSDNKKLIKETNKKNWGTEGVYDSEKYKDKLLKEKGYSNYFQSNEFKSKRKKSLIEHYGTTNLFSIPEIKNKIENTCLRKYGVKNVLLSEKCIKSKDNYYKNYAGKISSKPENITYELLKKKFNDVKRNYKSKEYPWKCDFYIPSKNMYIECQYSQYHMQKQFDFVTDQIKLNELKQKSEIRKSITGKKISQYDKMIYTWTDLDVRKRNKAKENNLNFIELWTLEQAKKFIKNL